MNGIMTRSRIAGLATIAALAAMVLPSTAMAGRSHLLKLYKVEQHVDLSGQDDTYTVKCAGNDIAMDGMWRVDNVEQDNDYVWTPSTGNPQFDVLRSVRPVEVRVDPTDEGNYLFRFTPESGGDVSMKLWVTCLGKKTESIGNHTHTWSITGGGTSSVDDSDLTWTSTNSAYTRSTACGPNEITVQPGFRVNTGDADLMTSRPVDKLDSSWEWQWDTVTPGFTADHFWSCLSTRSSTETPASSNPHRHRLIRQFVSNDPTYPYNSSSSSSPPKVKKNAVAEVQLHCGELYKGLIAGWHIGKGTPFDENSGAGPFVPYSHSNPGYGYLWYLGMDPRIKTRAFRFINAHLVNDYRADLYLVCFKDKTT